MKKKLIFSVGITGSGKSTFFEDCDILISTDEIRKNNLKNVDDLSQEKYIFRMALEGIVSLFEDYNVVHFDATNVETKHRTPFLDEIKERVNKMGYDIEFVPLLFPADPEISESRIRKDLEAELDRASSIHLIEEQFDQYLETKRLIREGKDKYLTEETIIEMQECPFCEIYNAIGEDCFICRESGFVPVRK